MAETPGSSDDGAEQHSVAWRTLDSFSKLAGIATPLVLGWLTVHLTYADQQKRSEQATADTILKVIELSIGKDDATKNVGLTMIVAIEQDGMGGLLDPKVVATDGFRRLLSNLTDTINAGGAGAAGGATALPTPHTGGTTGGTGASPSGAAPTLSPISETGLWVYLGTWDGVSKTWRTRYLGFNNNVPPADLKGKQLKVPEYIGSIYLRAGPSTESALEPIVGTLHPGQTVKIEDVQAGSQGTHLWARVTF